MQLFVSEVSEARQRSETGKPVFEPKLTVTPEESMGYWASTHWGQEGPGIYVGVSTSQDEFQVGVGVGLESNTLAGTGYIQMDSEHFRHRLEVDMSEARGFRYGTSIGFPWYIRDLVLESNAALRWSAGSFDEFRMGLRLEWPHDYGEQ